MKHSCSRQFYTSEETLLLLSLFDFDAQGWTPTNDIESVVVQIRAQMVVGKARIDFDSASVIQV